MTLGDGLTGSSGWVTIEEGSSGVLVVLFEEE
jgi:hypothetical protein